MNNETRVGIFVVAIIVTFILISIMIGELDLSRKETYPITMVFSTVEGLKKGSMLELAGVQVGKVKNIELNKDYSAVVTAEINEDIGIPIDSTASIATKGVLGDKIIVIKPGVSKNTIEPGGNLPRTTIPPSLDTLLEQVGVIAGNLTELTGTLNATLGDETMLRDILLNVRQLSEDSAALVAENREDIGEIIEGLKEITGSVAVISENFTGASEDLSDVLRAVSSGDGTIGKLVYDDSLYVNLSETLASIREFTSAIEEENTVGMLLSDPTLYHNLVAVSENIKTVTENLAEGRGTLGRIMTDDELYVNLNEAARNVNLAVQGLDEQVPITVMGTILGLIW